MSLCEAQAPIVPLQARTRSKLEQHIVQTVLQGRRKKKEKKMLPRKTATGIIAKENFTRKIANEMPNKVTPVQAYSA